jgi:hypothetical protein
MSRNEPTYELVAMQDIARLRRIEEAAKQVLDEWQRAGRSSTPLLAAIAALRTALREKTTG